MLKRILVMGLAVGIAGLIVSSCGSTKKIATVPTGSIITFVEDVPACGVVNFRTSVSGLALTPQGGDRPFIVFGGTSARQPFYKVDFGKLRDFSALMDIGSLPVGTYDKASISFVNPTLITYDTAFDPPIK